MLRQVAERVAVHCRVGRLGHRESLRYIEHVSACAGGPPSVFTRPATHLVARLSRGLPRRINILCHTALLFAYGQNERRVSRSVVRMAARRGLRSVPWTSAALARAGRVGRSLVPAAAVLAAVYLAGARVAPVPASSVVAVESEAIAAQTFDPSRIETAAAPRAPTEAREDGAPPPIVEVSAEEVPAARARSEDPSGDGPAADLASAPRASADLAPEPASPPIYEIRVPSGTTLTKLASDYYGDASPDTLRAIQRINPAIADTDRIRAGQTLRIAPLERHRTEVEE